MTTEKKQRKEREFKMRRATILAQAEKIFSRKGYHDVTMAEIAQAAGFSTGFIYQFFEGKEHLYSTMIGERVDHMYQSIEQEVGTGRDVYEKISVLIDSHLRFVEDNTDLHRIIFRGQGETLSNVMVAIREKLINNYLKHVSFIERILKAGVDGGVFRVLPCREMAAILLHMIRAASIDWIMIPVEESLLSRKDLILDVYLNGVKKHES